MGPTEEVKLDIKKEIKCVIICKIPLTMFFLFRS